VKVIYSEKLLEYHSPRHPESPDRIKLIYQTLNQTDQFQFIKPTPATKKDLLLVHTSDYVNTIKQNAFLKSDTPNIPNIYEFARLSVGSAIKAAQFALKEGVAFSLARPPGHHAGRNSAGGFCYFNNIAVATSRLLYTNRSIRAAILDIDVHHGNGTQEIFFGNNKVIFCSLHQSPLYPGTGLKSVNNCYNFPLPPNTSWRQYQPALTKAAKIISCFKPNILGVSLGLDAYKNDPLANFMLELNDYAKIGKVIKKLKLPTFFVLEGGYSKNVGKCALQLLTNYEKT
jgi:acetoin utilization deacetylase AcuC-like enzyme